MSNTPPDGIHTIDQRQLATYLRDSVAVFTGLQRDSLKLTKFSGGQSNPTFKLECNLGCYVLRKQPPGKLLKSAHAVDREFRVMQALRNTTVPVPDMIHLCTNADIIGAMFFVMEYMPGRTLWDSSLPQMQTEQRSSIYDAMNRVLSALHQVDVGAIGLDDFGRPGNYFARQLKRWSEQYHAAKLTDNPDMQWLTDWLHEHLPANDGRSTIVHGDYRLDNLRYHAEQPKIIAVLDWELSTLGHPFADLANLCMHMRMPSNIANMSGLAGVDVEALGIPTEQQFIQHYCEYSNLQHIDNWNFYLAFSIFRMAAILNGVAKRGLEGNASSDMATQVAQHIAPLAKMSRDIAAGGG